MSSVYGVFPGEDMTEEQKQRLEDLINEEIAKRGLTDRVQVSANVAVLSFVPSWDRDLSDAVDAGIEWFRALQ